MERQMKIWTPVQQDSAALLIAKKNIHNGRTEETIKSVTTSFNCIYTIWYLWSLENGVACNSALLCLTLEVLQAQVD